MGIVSSRGIQPLLSIKLENRAENPITISRTEGGGDENEHRGVSANLTDLGGMGPHNVAQQLVRILL